MSEATRRNELRKLIRKGLLPSDFNIGREIDRLERQDTDDQCREVSRAYGAQGPTPSTRWADPVQTAALAGLVRRWLEKHEMAALDDALEYCHGKNLPVLPPLLGHVVDAARERRSKAKSPLSPAQRAGIKDEGFRIMANLICLGITLERASEVAAVHSERTGHPLKASTLAKDYRKAWASGAPSRQDLLMRDRSDFPDPAQDDVWREIERQTAAPTPERKGERR